MPTTNQTDFSGQPDARGHFGRFGGMFVSETLMGPLRELREAYDRFIVDDTFKAELEADLRIMSAALHPSILPGS